MADPQKFAENLVATLMQTCDGLDPENAEECDEITRVIALNVAELQREARLAALREAITIIKRHVDGPIRSGERSMIQELEDKIIPAASTSSVSAPSSGPERSGT